MAKPGVYWYFMDGNINEESMQHIVSDTIVVKGGRLIDTILPVPAPKSPYFGLPSELQKQWEEYYRDIAVLAFRYTEKIDSIYDIDEKALYYRPPYTSVAGVKPYLVALRHHLLGILMADLLLLLKHLRATPVRGGSSILR